GSLGNTGTSAWLFSAKNPLQANRGIVTSSQMQLLCGVITLTNGTITAKGQCSTVAGTITGLTASSTTLSMTFTYDTTVNGSLQYPTMVRCQAALYDSATDVDVRQTASSAGSGSASATLSCFTPSTGAAVTCPSLQYFCNYD